MSRMFAIPKCPARPRALLSHAFGVNRLGALNILVLASVVSLAMADEPPPNAPYTVAFAPDSRRLAVTTGKPKSTAALTVWDTATLRRLWVVMDARGIPAAAFAPDGQTVAAGHFSERAKVYESSTGKLLATYGGHGAVARAVGFAPDGRLLAVGTYEGVIKLWDQTRGALVRTLASQNGRIYGLLFSPDGKRLLSIGANAACLWDVGTGQQQHVLRHGGSLVRAGLFAPDGRSVLTGGWDWAVCCWDAETGTTRWRLEDCGGGNALAYCPSRDLLAMNGTGRQISLVSPVFRQCDASQRRRLEVLLAQLDDDSYALREAVSREIMGMGLMAEPWLRRLMTESQSAEVRLRCRYLRKQLLTTPQAELSGHGDEVESVAFAPDGNLMASVDRSGRICLWDVATRRIRAHFRPSETAGHLDDDAAHRAREDDPG